MTYALPHLILFGFPGAGKSTLGKTIARIMDLPCIDTDELIEHRCNLSCSTIVNQHGIDFFRSLEKEIILSLAPTTPSIVVVGGGGILDDENLFFLQKLGTLFFIDIDRETLAGRLEKRGSPFNLPKFYEERLPKYQRISCQRIDLTGKTLEESTREILKLYRGADGQ